MDERDLDSGRHRVSLLVPWVVILSSLLSSCGQAPPTGDRLTLNDELGRRMELPARPQRIVSLAPSVTDSLLALGARDRLVGVSDFCALPPGTGPIARVGGILNPSLETIRDLHPDLLIATTSGNDPSLARQAASIGLPLYTIHTPDVESVLRSLLDLSRIIGEEERGRALVGGLRARLSAVNAAIAGRPPVKVLFVVWGEPLIVPGRSSFLTDGLALAGGISITADAPAAYPAFEVESAIARAPEVILTTPQNRALLDRLAREPAWARVPAVTHGRLAVVSEAIEQPGPGVVSGIEEVARALHPDALGAPGASAPPATRERVNP
jgi:iron complex transport system substrate-binding protein